MVEDRIAALEAHAATLEDRVRTLEGRRAAAPVARPAPPSRPAPSSRPAPPSRPAPAPARPSRDLEDVLGGSVLAWLGGVAVLAGLAFLLTIAISRGWLGEGARTVLAGLISLGLLAVGVWLRERRGRNEAALAAAAVGVAGGFGTLVVAGPVYDLVPQALALAGAFAVGTVATALAVRWHAHVMGWLGLLGTLLAPAALDALHGGGIVFLAVGYAVTVVVLVRQRWPLLAGVASAVATAQWLWWLFEDVPRVVPSVVAMTTFGALTLVLALGLAVRDRDVEPTAAALLPGSAAILALAGWEHLGSAGWLVALAIAYLALGLATARVERIAREVALIALAVGVLIADAALAAYQLDELVLVIVWAVSALPFAALLGARAAAGPRHVAVARVCDAILAPARPDWFFAAAALAWQLALAAGLVLTYWSDLGGPRSPVAELAAVAAVAAALWASARLADLNWRIGLDALALTALAYLTGLALEGVALSVALAGEAVALVALARVTSRGPVVVWGAVAFAGLALVHAVAVLAPPIALLDGLDTPGTAAVALAAAVVALFVAGQRSAAAVALLYLLSVEVVTLGGPDHTGQTLLSVLWAVAGVGAVIVGLVRDDRALRRGALALLALTAGKVFLYDLSELESLYRVGSLIGFGLLLLCGAYVWQRLRPGD